MANAINSRILRIILLIIILSVLCTSVFGMVMREWWLSVPGASVNDLISDPRYPNSPDGRELLDMFEGPVNWGDNYGSRLWGWLVPVKSGEYTFWIAGDDCSELWLSIDENPANCQLIASVNGWTRSQEWDKYETQKSEPIILQAGNKYYIEALMKESGGGDNIAVAWQPPESIREVISSKFVNTLQADSPEPADGTFYMNNWVKLSWTPGVYAALNDVYFSSDLEDVAQRKASVLIATTDVPSVSVGRPDCAFPDGLQMGTTYYWCVDEVNDTEPDSPWRGEVWSFRIPTEPAAYLLITSEELVPAFQVLVDWRTAEELAGQLVTLEHIYAHYTGVDEQDKIRNCIKDYYENNGTIYVTLGGDNVVVPVRYCYVSETYDIPTDLYYGGLDGTWDEDGDGIYGEAKEDNADLYPEVWVGRIPIQTAQQASDYINKVILYESRSPDGFSQTMLLAGAMHGPKVSGTERPEGFFDHEPVSTEDRGMVTQYRNEMQPYWQATPLHKLIDTKSSWDSTRCGDYDFTPKHFTECFNLGYHHVWIRAHGRETFYEFERKGGRKMFYTDDALALINSDRLSIIYGEGCITGAFDIAEPSISEAFLRCPNGGAVVYVGCSRTNFGRHHDLFYREIFVNKRKRIGEAFGHYKMAWVHESMNNSWQRWVQFGRNLQGDSALRILGAESVRDLQLSSPEGCEVIEKGTDLTIRWNASGTDFNIDEKVKLEYSSDSGKTWHPIPGAESLPYNGRFFIWENCPLSSGSNYRVRVSSLTDLTINDMSAQDFTVGELVILTVQTSPIEDVVINISSDTTDVSDILSNFNITILEGALVNVSAPTTIEDSSEFEFVRWMDDSGNTIKTTPDYTFIITQDKTIIAEYTGP